MGGFGSGDVTLSKKERCEKVYAVMASAPMQEWTCSDIHMKIHRYLSLTQIRSALTALSKEGRIKYVRKGGRFGLPATWVIVAPVTDGFT
jgi:hypothetical protein